MRSHVRKTLVAIGLLTAGGFALTTQGAADSKTTPKETIITADTAPSETPKLSFNFPGIVKEVLVKEGDVIKRGQPLMVQDDDIEQAELDRLKAEADSEARIDYYKADRDYKQATRDRKVNAAEGAFSDAEKDEAKADYVKAERQIDVANLDHNGDKIKGRQQALKVEKMTLKSTIDGIVQKIGVHAGELAEMDKDKPAINLVKNDPCYVEIKELTSAQVARVAVGETMEVRYPGEKDWQQAKVIFIDPVTFSGSDLQLVRLELPNPQNRATGVSIEVKLPPKLAELMPASNVGRTAAANR